MVPINYLAVIVAALISMVVGALWYGPLFGKPWMALMKLTEADKNNGMKNAANKSYALMMLGSLVTAFVLAHSAEFAMTYTKTFGVVGGLMVGFWTWIGFIAPTQLSSVLWESKPWKLYALNTSYSLVSLLLQGMVIAVWR
jgi:Protein of unknown function (DUF1761)